MSLFDTVEVVDPNKEYLPELVGEGKSYKDQEALAKAAVHKELHIRRLEAEMATLRQQVSSAPKEDRMKEILDKLDALNTPVTPPTPPNSQGNEQRPEAPKEITDADIERVLTRREQANAQAKNLEAVTEALVRKFGPNYSQHLETVRKDLGVGRDFLEDAAKHSPAAFLKLVGAGEVPKGPQGLFTPPQSQQTFTPQVTEKTLSYYTKLRRERPQEYTKAMERQEMADALRLGEAFFD